MGAASQLGGWPIKIMLTCQIVIIHVNYAGSNSASGQFKCQFSLVYAIRVGLLAICVICVIVTCCIVLKLFNMALKIAH